MGSVNLTNIMVRPLVRIMPNEEVPRYNNIKLNCGPR
jgi:hypothetical protein